MKSIVKKILLLLLVSVWSLFASDYSAIEFGNTKVYRVGEKIVIPIALESLPGGVSGFKCLDPNPGPKEKDQIPSDYGLIVNYDENASSGIKPVFKIAQCQKVCKDDKTGGECETGPNWHNLQKNWIEAVAEAKNPGEYEGYISLYKSGNPETVDVRFKFKVEDSFPDAPNGLAVLFADSSASYDKQIDINMSIKNVSNQGVAINNAYLDYYLTKNAKKAMLNVWYSAYKENQICVEVYKCGNQNFIIREYIRDINLGGKDSIVMPQVGYMKGSAIEGDKKASSNYKDFSYEYPAISYEIMAHNRNRYYNDHVALYVNGSPNPVWGESPSWAHSCSIAQNETDYSQKEGKKYFCNGNIPLPSSSSVQSSSSYSSSSYSSSSYSSSSYSSSSYSSSSWSSSSINFVPRSSSSSFSAFRDLAVQFMDGDPSNKYYGGFQFKIVNKGNVDIPIGGDEIRFYYNGDENTKVPPFFDPQNSVGWDSPISRASLEQCDENLYVLKIKLKNNLVAGKSSLFPQYNAIRVEMKTNNQEMAKELMYSWTDAAILTENSKVALFDAAGSLLYGTEPWPCDGYTKKRLDLVVYGEAKKIYWGPYINAAANITFEISNRGDSVISEPIHADFHVTHPAGQVPVFSMNGKKMATNGESVSVGNNVSVMLISSGNKHTYRFTFSDGIGANTSKSVSFQLYDQCLFECNDPNNSTYLWHFSDDWSVKDILGSWSKTDKVPIYNSRRELLYGKSDPSAPVIELKQDGSLSEIKHARATVDVQKANRTDAVVYSVGQLLSGGDFETPWLQGWEYFKMPNEDLSVKSVRGQAPQGSRFLSMDAGTSVYQILTDAAAKILIDSGAVLTVWHRGGKASIYLNGALVGSLAKSESWKLDTLSINCSNYDLLGYCGLNIHADGDRSIQIDDVVLVPSKSAQPTTYATRFTNMAGEEIETRAYDGASEQLVTTSERDLMGRLTRKYLPFAVPCNSVVDCNSNVKTQNNPGLAKSYYTASNPDYPDAGNFPYAETRWKPDPMTTLESEGAPGAAFAIPAGHVVKTYSSGVNLDGIDLLNLNSLNTAVAAVPGQRGYYNGFSGLVYDVRNYHAAKDANPTHLWELVVDQNGHAAFTVKDGENRVIVSGAIDLASGKVISRSVNELDGQGNVVKSHSPMSCEYVNAPSNCVAPDSFVYDAQSRLIESHEADAGESRTYYDHIGRVRATQTQKQIDSSKATVFVYDNFDRVVHTGVYNVVGDKDEFRSYLMDVSTSHLPSSLWLIPGTVTRTFYDTIPYCDTLGVHLCPGGVRPTYTRGRVAAVVSDVRAVFDADGSLIKASDKTDSVIRVTSVYSYDKYGRVVANFYSDPTMPVDSLEMLAVTTQYDLGGKVIAVMKYPYGINGMSWTRNVVENYIYDRLGRISAINTKNGGASTSEIVRYEYYPTGSVKTVTMGNSVTLTYTYHISGAVKTATIQSADGKTLYADTLYYEDCNGNGCTPQYNGNISRMVYELAHGNDAFAKRRDVKYTYDLLNRLTRVDDAGEDYFDEYFAYDEQGRIVAQRRDTSIAKNVGGEYTYESGTNRLKSVAMGMGGTADERPMSDADNFVYDRDGRLVEDRSKHLTITYDWRGMPVEFKRETACNYHGHPLCDSTKLVMDYDGTGRRISKTRARKEFGGDWETELVTHYTGIGTEVRENPVNGETKVVVNLPNGLGRYMPEDASAGDFGFGGGYMPPEKFEWYLKNHLGSTMLVYGTQGYSWTDAADVGSPIAAYDYRAFGEQVSLAEPSDKVTENFTGKERDDETELDYFGARYLDPMLGMWISVDPARQFASPYLYAGNGVNPVNGVDPDGNVFNEYGNQLFEYMKSTNFNGSKTLEFNMTRAHDDPNLYFNIKPVRIAKIEPSAHNEPGFKKTYDVYFPVDMNADGTDLSVMTYIHAGHELNHPYTIAKAGHNNVENVKTESEYFDKLQQMANEPEPDKIYLDDYNSAKEMGVYDE